MALAGSRKTGEQGASGPRSLAQIAADATVRINPLTGLTTDFTNVFTEVIMLLEMLDDWPDALADQPPWQPFIYDQHFEQSGYADKALILEAYHRAPLHLLANLDTLTADANALLAAELPAIRADPPGHIAAARDLAAALRELVDRMTAIVNGHGETSEQADVDALFGADATMDAADIDALFD